MAPTVRLTPRSKDSKCNGSRPSPFGSFDRARADDFEKDRPATLPSFVRAKLGTIDVPVVRRSCCDGKAAPCAECADEGEVQRTPVSSSGTFQAPPSVSAALRGSGTPLASNARTSIEGALGRSFADVRIHADTAAARSAAEIGAEAYTVGRDIVFAPGRYAPDTPAGRRLLGHELVHVAQQRNASPVHGNLVVGPENCEAEREADSLSLHGGGAPSGAHVPIVRRQARGSCAGKGPFNCNGTTCRTPAGRAGTCMWISASRSCFCRDNSTDEPAPASKLIPSWLMPLLGAAAVAAIIACFATGLCEFGAVVVGLGAAATAAVLFLLRQAGITDSGSSGGPTASAGQTAEPEASQVA